MSKRAVAELLKEADEGSALRQELEAAVASAENKAEAFVSTAAKHGYEFSAQEYAEAVAEADSEPDRGELTDDELDSVSGGAGATLFIPQPNLVWGHKVFSQIGFPGGVDPKLEMGGPGGWTP